IVEPVRAIPGVDSAAGGLMIPFGGQTWNDAVIPEGSSEEKGVAWQNYVGPGYFRAIGTPLLSGRDFDENDTATSVKVAIVNQAFVRKVLNGENPLGKRFRLHVPPGNPQPFYLIVGVVGDFKFQDMHEDYLPFTIFPATQLDRPQGNQQVVIRSELP